MHASRVMTTPAIKQPMAAPATAAGFIPVAAVVEFRGNSDAEIDGRVDDETIGDEVDDEAPV